MNKVIEYWNKHGLSSEFSSTSHGNLIFDKLNHTIETELIRLHYMHFSGRVLDIGAGNGRLSKFFLNKGYEVDSLEPASRLFEKLKFNLSGFENSNCFDKSILDFSASHKYSLIILSGILFYYDDSVVFSILNKSKDLLDGNGGILVRDYLVKEELTSYSSQINDNFCYFRTLNWWHKAAQNINLRIQSIYQCRPKYTLFYQLLRENLFGIAVILKPKFIQDRVIKKIINKRDFDVNLLSNNPTNVLMFLS